MLPGQTRTILLGPQGQCARQMLWAAQWLLMWMGEGQYGPSGAASQRIAGERADPAPGLLPCSCCVLWGMWLPLSGSLAEAGFRAPSCGLQPSFSLVDMCSLRGQSHIAGARWHLHISKSSCQLGSCHPEEAAGHSLPLEPLRPTSHCLPSPGSSTFGGQSPPLPNAAVLPCSLCPACT